MSKIIESNKVYTAEEAAKVLGSSTETIVDYCREGKIVAKKVKEWKILGQSLIDFLTAEPNPIAQPDDSWEEMKRDVEGR